MTDRKNTARIAIIGCGAMGSAIARGVVSAGLYGSDDVCMSDVDEAKLALCASELGVCTTTDNAKACEAADIVVLAVKPALVGQVLAGLEKVLASDVAQPVDGGGMVETRRLIISIAAGVTLGEMQAHVQDRAGVIRAMPNTPAQVGCGAVGFARGKATTDDQVAAAQEVFSAIGTSYELSEKLLDAVTGLSGSGPAYVYMMVEAMADAGVRVGLTRDVALGLAAQTVYGAAKMVIETGAHPAQLKDAVTSPGGTTIAGVDELEARGFRSAVFEAVKAATERSKELGKK